jgi:hypothetical protein
VISLANQLQYQRRQVEITENRIKSSKSDDDRKNLTEHLIKQRAILNTLRRLVASSTGTEITQDKPATPAAKAAKPSSATTV